MSMQIPFDVSFRVEARDGWTQRGEFVVWADKAAMARVKAREIIQARCGERAAYVHAEPQQEGHARR